MTTHQIDCPCCGSKLKLEINISPVSALELPTNPVSRPAKSDYAGVRVEPAKPVEPPKPAPIPNMNPKPKFRLDTDTGKFRQALQDAGFSDIADGIIFNDCGKRGTRRLKLWFGRRISESATYFQQRLAVELKKQFGERLVECGEYVAESMHGPGRRSYVVRLKV